MLFFGLCLVRRCLVLYVPHSPFISLFLSYFTAVSQFLFKEKYPDFTVNLLYKRSKLYGSSSTTKICGLGFLCLKFMHRSPCFQVSYDELLFIRYSMDITPFNFMIDSLMAIYTCLINQQVISSFEYLSQLNKTTSMLIIVIKTSLY